MEGNDIGVSLRMRYACKFEGLLMREEVEETTKKRLFRTSTTAKRKWVPNDAPLKSLIHLTQNLGIAVVVVTWMGVDAEEEVGTWLARKGAHVQVVGYDDVYDFMDDFRYDRELHTFFTADEEDAHVVGIRATVVPSDRTWGF